MSARERRSADAVDLFAGAGGWDVAARSLGLDVLGIEDDPQVVATRTANGLRTLAADVRDVRPRSVRALGLIASPPCQTFSLAGKGAGRDALDQVLQLVEQVERGHLRTPPHLDPRTLLVVEPLVWALDRARAGRPFDWIALEQVPTVLPVWVEFARVLRGYDYSVDVARLHAEQYGVPQTRTRAFLLACLGRDAALPAPTHKRYHARSGARDWHEAGLAEPVTMSDALGWGAGSVVVSNYGTGGDARNRGRRNGDEPSATITTHANRNVVWHEQDVDGLPRLRRASAYEPDLTWPQHRPSTTVAGRPLVVHPGEIANRFNEAIKSRNDGVRLTVAEAAALQSFPPNYVWPAKRQATFDQIGNAVPPLLAEQVLLQAIAPQVCVRCGACTPALVDGLCEDCLAVLVDEPGALRRAQGFLW